MFSPMVSTTDWLLIIARRFSKFPDRVALLACLSPIVASIQGETGRHLIVYPVALVAASANRDRHFSCLFSVPGSNQEISGTGFRYLAEMILAPSQKPVLSQFEFQRWVRSGHSLTRPNDAGAPQAVIFQHLAVADRVAEGGLRRCLQCCRSAAAWAPWSLTNLG